MLGFLYRLLIGSFKVEVPKEHAHKWKTVDKIDIKYYDSFIGHCYFMECEECGEHKKQTLSLLGERV